MSNEVPELKITMPDYSANGFTRGDWASKDVQEYISKALLYADYRPDWDYPRYKPDPLDLKDISMRTVQVTERDFNELRRRSALVESLLDAIKLVALLAENRDRARLAVLGVIDQMNARGDRREPQEEK